MIVSDIDIEQNCKYLQTNARNKETIKIWKKNLSNKDWLNKTTFNIPWLLNEWSFLLCYQKLFSNKLGFILDSSLIFLLAQYLLCFRL
jgi:hypothetical protein